MHVRTQVTQQPNQVYMKPCVFGGLHDDDGTGVHAYSMLFNLNMYIPIYDAILDLTQSTQR